MVETISIENGAAAKMVDDFKKLLQSSRVYCERDCLQLKELLDAALRENQIKLLQDCFTKFFNLTKHSYQECCDQYQQFHEEKMKTADNLQQKIQEKFTEKIFLTGSMFGKISIPSSDYDFGFNEKIAASSLRPKMYALATIFKSDGYLVIDHFYGQRNVKFIHLDLKKNGKPVKIDIASDCNSYELAKAVSNLSQKFRLIIVAVKVFFDLLGMIDTKNKKLSGGCIVIAFLCYLRDTQISDEDRTVNDFARFWSTYNFQTNRMTTNGTEKKMNSQNLEIIECHSRQVHKPDNVAFSTSFSAMQLAQQWLSFLAEFPEIDQWLFSKFFES